MSTKTKPSDIPNQITVALDGRTQRWLSFEVKIPETLLSRKMKGHLEFTDDELLKIEKRLDFKFEK